MDILNTKIKNIKTEKTNKVRPENIKSGVSIFGITGTYTNDANATANDIKTNKTAYVNGTKITGQFNGVDTSDANAGTGDIKTGKTAYVNGSKLTGTFTGVDSSDADATAGDIKSGKTAYVNNIKLTGTLEEDYAKFQETDRIDNVYVCYIYKPLLQEGDLEDIEDIFENNDSIIQTLISIVESDSNSIEDTLLDIDIDTLKDIIALCDLTYDLFLFTEGYYDVLTLHIESTSALSADIYNGTEYGIYSVSVEIEQDIELGEESIAVSEIINFIDTGDADATASDIISGKTAYVNGEYIEGTLVPPSPSGTISITQNGTVDVTNYASANVNVSAITNKSIAVVPVSNPSHTPSLVDFVTEVDTTNWNVSNITTCFVLFNNCMNLTSIDLSGFAVNNITNTTDMFTGCTSLTSVDCRPFNFSKVTNVSSMFSGCSALTSVNFSGCDLSKITNTKFWFRFDENLTTLDFTGCSLTKATTLQSTFPGCTSLSNDSLNQILALLATATSYTGTKTLRYVGLDSTQATTCTSLSNWSALQARGWTTGN